MMRRIKKILIGNARSISDPSLFYRLSLIAFFAWVELGADGITSSCYGPKRLSGARAAYVSQHFRRTGDCADNFYY